MRPVKPFVGERFVTAPRNLHGNAEKFAHFGTTGLRIDSVDPTRPQDDTTDPGIEYGVVDGVPYCASCNAELYKQLTPEMIEVMKQIA